MCLKCGKQKNRSAHYAAEWPMSVILIILQCIIAITDALTCKQYLHFVAGHIGGITLNILYTAWLFNLLYNNNQHILYVHLKTNLNLESNKK